MQQKKIIDLTDDQPNREAPLQSNQVQTQYENLRFQGVGERSNQMIHGGNALHNQHQFSIPLQHQLHRQNPTDRFLTMFHDDYSRPRILNTEQYLQLNGINPNTGPSSSSHQSAQMNQNANYSQSGQFHVPGNVDKRRVLPSTVTVPPSPVIDRSVSTSNPYYQNLQNRQQILTNSNSQRPAGHLPYCNTNAYYQPPPQNTPLLQKVPIVFSLVNAEDFTARVETGSVPRELVQFLARIQGSTFDWKLKRFTFPIMLHDQLQTTLQQKFNCIVEPIPRAVLAAAQLKSRSAQLKQAASGNGNTAEDIIAKEKKLNEYLGKVLPQYLLDSLATFQKEAVQFIIEKKGRALIGDEMGLGKTRTGIAAACVYHRDWPVLIVCPSSARHHWYAELNALIVNAHRPEFQNRKLPSSESLPNESIEDINDHPSPVKKASPIVIDMTTNTSSSSPPPPPPPLPSSLNLQPFPLISSEDIVLIEKTNHFLQRSIDKYSTSKFFIISYALITKLAASLQSIPFNVIVVDESHYIKSRQAKRTKSLVPMIQRCKRAILLSGTPALSRPLELFTQLNALLPKQWNDFKAFGKRYCQDATAKQVNSLSNSHGSTSQRSSGSGGGKTYSLFSNGHHRFKGFGDNAYKGANHTQELHVILTSTIMIRRLKKDILLQLPKKKRYLMKVEVEDYNHQQILQGMLEQLRKYEELLLRKNYHSQKSKQKDSTNSSTSSSNHTNNDNNTEEMKLQDWLQRSSSTAQTNPTTTNTSTISNGGGLYSALTEGQELELQELKQQKKNILLKLFTISGEAKVSAILKKLDLLFLRNPQFTGKILLFAHHHYVLSQISRHLIQLEIPFIRIDGMTSSKERHQLTQSFQQDISIRVGVLGITAAGIALTLTAANIVCFLELYWTPGSLIQAEDRVHRIGQLKNVKIFYFFGINTIDELLWPLVRKKMQLLGEFVEGTTDQDLTAAVLNQSSTTSASTNPQSVVLSKNTTEDKPSTDRLERMKPATALPTPPASQDPERGRGGGMTETGKEEEDGVMDPVTRKMYSLETDEDILQLVEELNEEEIQTIGSYHPRDSASTAPLRSETSSSITSTMNTTATTTTRPPLINLEEEEEEFKELVKESPEIRNRKKKRKQSNKKSKKSRQEEEEEEGKGGGGDEDEEEDDDDEEGEEEEVEGEEGEDEYEEYLKRVDPPDILASVYMHLVEDEKRRKEMKQFEKERQQQMQELQRQNYSFSGLSSSGMSQFGTAPLTSSFTIPSTTIASGGSNPHHHHTSGTSAMTMSGSSFSIPRFNRPRTPEIIDLVEDQSPPPPPNQSQNHYNYPPRETSSHETSQIPSSSQGIPVEQRNKVTASSLEVNDRMFDDIDLQILETISPSPVSYHPIPSTAHETTSQVEGSEAMTSTAYLAMERRKDQN